MIPDFLSYTRIPRLDIMPENNALSSDKPGLLCNEFIASSLPAGQITLVHVGDERVAVYNADGAFYATEERCPHTGWPLSDGGELSGTQVTCPMHGWCFDVTSGAVIRGIKGLCLKQYRVQLDGDIGRVIPLDS